MSELHRAVQAEIDAHTPALTPPFDAIKARKRGRDRNRLAAAAALGIVGIASAAFAVPGLGEQRDDRLAPAPAFATSDWTPEGAFGYAYPTPTFVSPTYGYSFRYIDRGGLEPATELWDPSNQPMDDIKDLDPRFDSVETALAAYFEAASTPLPKAVVIDDWVEEHVTALAAGGCDIPRRQQSEITVDGQSGRLATCANRIEATVVTSGRLYLFVLAHDRGDARAMFDAWMTTVALTPETATP